MADFLYGGAADVLHQQPASVRAALSASNHIELTPAQRELDAKLAPLGVEITTVQYPQCPTGPGQWIKTKSSWTACEELLGMRWRTPEGWCYPSGMCAIDEADSQTRELATVRKVELYQRIMNALNTTRLPERDKWLQRKSEEFRKYSKTIKLPQTDDSIKEYTNKGDDQSPLYDNMTDKQRQAFYDLVQADMPFNIKDLPTLALVKTQHDAFAELKSKAKAKADVDTKDVQIKKLMDVLRRNDTVPPAGMDLKAFAEQYYDEAVKCSDGSIGKRYADAKAACTTGDLAGTCDFLDYGDEEDALCMPSKLAARKDKWLKGETDELAAWFGELFDERSQKKAAEATKVARALGTRARAF